MLDTIQSTGPTQRLVYPPKRRSWFKRHLLLNGILAAGLVVLLAELLRIFAGSNFHVVLPGKCYRSAQPTAALLDSAHRNYGIRTIVNLRDENEDEPWYQEEKQAAQRLGIQLINAGLSSKEQAPAVDFRKFVQVMKDAEEPILIHCANGNDRSGLASAVYFMMRTKMPLAECRRQISLRYGHIAWSKASCLSRTLDSYEAWLDSQGWEHSADRFHFWGTNIYWPELPN
jgi:protein tyrosine phosphatase (PTP) superfamily phosphohydrolase (DUF442 family)